MKKSSTASKTKQPKLTLGGPTKQQKTDPNDPNVAYLDRIQDMVETLNATNGANEKTELILKYPDMKPFIQIVYDPLRPFHVTSSTLKKFNPTNHSDVTAIEFGNLLELLEALDNRQITGHVALKTVMLKWVMRYSEHSDLLYNIIDKDLKIRMGVKQLNKAFPALIPEFSVTLGYDFNKYPKALLKDKWRVSRKLDGVRCIVIVSPSGAIQFYSRVGNEFLTLGKLEAEIQKHIVPLYPQGVVLDGEVCIIDKDGNEDFKSVMKELRKKNHVMSKPRYLLFDCLTLQEFRERTSTRIFSERIKDLDHIRAKTQNVPEIQIIDQLEYTPERLAEMNDNVEKYGWEGLIVRKDTRYEGKRTSSVLKVKKFETEEYKVLDIQHGPVRAHNVQTGLTDTIETVVSVTILHKNCAVSVGSGFSLAERKRFYDHPEELKGQIIAVQFFEETTDADGDYSLRFPTFKGVHGKSRTT
jgi:DNA ligase-1